MRGKISKQIRRYLRDMYPELEKKEPIVFNRMCNALKDKYEETSVDVKGKIMEKE